ncbi:Omega-crystallin [Arthrobotrys entomopaga]|nr:Omega-crystallin [Arthrobotrys entomopaga]
MSFERDSTFCVPLWINGAAVCPGDSPRYDVTTPPSQSLAWSACAATPPTIEDAISSASRAYLRWSRTSLAERIEIFSKAAGILSTNSSEISYYLAKEIGTGPGWATFNQSFCVKALETIGDALKEAFHTEELDGQDEIRASIQRVPYGVVASIAPWCVFPKFPFLSQNSTKSYLTAGSRNAPLILGLRAILAPVAAGNTVVMLSAPLSPMSHHFLALLLHSAGLPAGVLNILPAPPSPEKAAEVVETLLKHTSVRYLNFTGSTAVGKKINEVAGRYGKPVTMELGGKCVALALEDADMETLARELVVGAYLNSGQICMSTELAIIPKSLVTPLVQQLVAKIPQIFPELAFPLVTCASKTKTLDLIDDAVQKGAILYSSNGEEASEKFLQSLADDPSSSMTPLFLTKVTKDMRIYKTETFAPVFCIVEYDGKNVQEAVDITNELEFGLSVSIFSQDEQESTILAQYIDAAAIHFNHMTVYDNPLFPHGGVKGSGYGRFGGKWGIEEFTYIKTLTYKKTAPKIDNSSNGYRGWKILEDYAKE